jgi:hypothetical protein
LSVHSTSSGLAPPDDYDAVTSSPVDRFDRAGQLPGLIQAFLDSRHSLVYNADLTIVANEARWIAIGQPNGFSFVGRGIGRNLERQPMLPGAILVFGRESTPAGLDAISNLSDGPEQAPAL